MKFILDKKVYIVLFEFFGINENKIKDIFYFNWLYFLNTLFTNYFALNIISRNAKVASGIFPNHISNPGRP